MGVKVWPRAQYWPRSNDAQTARAKAGSQPHATEARHRCTPCSNFMSGPWAGPRGARRGSDAGGGPPPTTSASARRTRSERPGKRCARAEIAGAQSVASVRASLTRESAARASRSASTRSARMAGGLRASAKAAAQATRISADSADKAASSRETRCARSAARKESMAGTREHNADSFTKTGGEASGKRARAGRSGGRAAECPSEGGGQLEQPVVGVEAVHEVEEGPGDVVRRAWLERLEVRRGVGRR